MLRLTIRATHASMRKCILEICRQTTPPIARRVLHGRLSNVPMPRLGGAAARHLPHHWAGAVESGDDWTEAARGMTLARCGSWKAGPPSSTSPATGSTLRRPRWDWASHRSFGGAGQRLHCTQRNAQGQRAGHLCLELGKKLPVGEQRAVARLSTPTTNTRALQLQALQYCMCVQLYM